MLALRPYQQDAVSAVYRYLRNHDDNPVVVIPTAGGKTPILATICRDAVQNWEGRVLVVSHVKELLEQAVGKLKDVCPELPVGVYSAGLNRRDTREKVIVAGIPGDPKPWKVCNNNSTSVIDEYTEDEFRRLHLASGPWVVVPDEPAPAPPPRLVPWWR